MNKKNEEHGLPPRIFVRWDKGGVGDDPWLMTQQKESDLAERDEHFIGVYELKEVHAVKLVTTKRTISKPVKA